MSEIICTLRDHIPNSVDRRSAYRRIIKAFEDTDWDTHEECLGEDPVWDEALYELYPDLQSDEELEDD